jgi:hypothetical protein
MNVNQYYSALKVETEKIFLESSNENTAQNTAHDLITNLQVWYTILNKEDSSTMLINSIEELDISCLQMMQGLYRGAFSSLRLSLEMLTGSVYFSAHNIEYKEWEKGSKDLIWATISCKENGVLSKRFAEAYFPELKDEIGDFSNRVKSLYRSLSEMVHGNYSTWNYDKPSLSFNSDINNIYNKYAKEYNELSNYILSLRFINTLTVDEISELEPHLLDSLEHVTQIRIKIGGSI